ncbi:MAG: hypothetical protein ACNA74_01130 [Desulfurivibrio sp.]
MPPLSALYFPDLLPPPAAAAALTELLAPLRCYRISPDLTDAPPTAPGRQPAPPSFTPWTRLRESGKLEFYQPLAADRIDLARLHQLLRELEGRSGQDAALFVQGILAGLSAGRQELASELVGPLLGFHEDPAAREEEETLWRALLLLKLAEIQERRELELVEELRGFEESRAALFRQLRGEEETATPAKTQDSLNPGKNSTLLLRAWGQLFLRDQRPTELLVSADPDAVALLLDHATTLNRREPLSLGRLQLPTAAGPPIPDQARSELARALGRAAAEGNGEVAAMAIATCNQTRTLEPGKGESGAGYGVEFLLLPGISLGELLARFCRRPPTPGGQNGSGRGEPPHGLIALLR